MATQNAVDTSLSGQTGTSSFVGSTSPTLITPILGAATATSITFSPTTGGIVGTTTNDNAGAGKVGELISSVIASGSPVSFTSTVTKDLTSISLTAGDWDVSGNIYFSATTVLAANVWISATSATLPDTSLRALVATTAGASALSVCAPYFRASLSGTTTIYISGDATSTGTLTGVGGIYARRVR